MYSTYDYYLMIEPLLFTIGLFFIFRKFKISGLWSLVPVVKIVKLAQCADREDDVGPLIVFDIIYSVLRYMIGIAEDHRVHYNQVYLLLVYLSLGVFIFYFVYFIKLYSGLCEQFNVSKAWCILWLISNSLVALFWGLSRKMQPSPDAIYVDIDQNEEIDDKDHLDKGLTVNIKDRKVTEGIKKKYLLKDIYLNIEPGKMVLLLGGSGAGKTTFLNAVNGYEPANAKITLNGDDVYKHFDKMKYEIGFVPQQDLIRYQDTVYHTLADSARLKLPTKIHHKELNKRIDEVLDIFGLKSVKNNLVAKQSGGQKKRISIAMEFISDPSLFILDEPDSGLDGIMARDLMTRLHEISRKGKIVIVITHTPDRVIDLFDEVIVLGKDSNRTGRLVFKGTIDEAKTFFGKDKMEDVVKCVNRQDEGGEGRTDELIKKFEEGRNGK